MDLRPARGERVNNGLEAIKEMIDYAARAYGLADSVPSLNTNNILYHLAWPPMNQLMLMLKATLVIPLIVQLQEREAVSLDHFELARPLLAASPWCPSQEPRNVILRLEAVRC